MTPVDIMQVASKQDVSVSPIFFHCQYRRDRHSCTLPRRTRVSVGASAHPARRPGLSASERTGLMHRSPGILKAGKSYKTTPPGMVITGCRKQVRAPSASHTRLRAVTPVMQGESQTHEQDKPVQNDRRRQSDDCLAHVSVNARW